MDYHKSQTYRAEYLQVKCLGQFFFLFSSTTSQSTYVAFRQCQDGILTLTKHTFEELPFQCLEVVGKVYLSLNPTLWNYISIGPAPPLELSFANGIPSDYKHF